MDVQAIISAISTVGFPIVCVIIMFKVYREDLGKLQDSINNNTLVIQKLLDKLESLDKEVKKDA